jgi:crossover junction endodeoxyribonuclease RuvC
VGISAKDFAQISQRLAGKKPRGGTNTVATAPATRPDYRRVLGVDPSLRGTGFGVIEVRRPQSVMLVSGTIRCPAGWERSRCLAHIATSLRDVIRQQQPEVCAIEGLFFAQNLRTALTMGEARGAALAVIAEAGLPIYELAPRKVKLAIVGYGAAQKIAVAKMVQRLLALAELPEPDAADALALALAYLQEGGRAGLSAPKRV